MESSESAEWELSKENVLPLRRGRQVPNLLAALQTDNQDRFGEKRREFEEELSTYSGNDLFDVWERYIKWVEENYPKGGKNGNLEYLLERCIRYFNNDEKYKDDPRYVDVWLKFAELSDDPFCIIEHMFEQKIGCACSNFFETWAWKLECLGSNVKADAVFQEGIRRNAQPLDHLKRLHSEFQIRTVREMINKEDIAAFSGGVSEDQRESLGGLRGSGKHHTVSSVRTGNAKKAFKGGLFQQTTSKNSQGKQQFQPFIENKQKVPLLMSQSGEMKTVPSRSIMNKENNQEPDIWTKARARQKTGAVSFSDISDCAKPMFTVHTDADSHNRAAQNPLTQTPMYSKEEVYTRTEEFSFEEIRAARWKTKHRQLQEKELEENNKLLLQQQRKMIHEHQEMSRVRQEIQQELLRQHEEFLRSFQLEQLNRGHENAHQLSNENDLQLQDASLQCAAAAVETEQVVRTSSVSDSSGQQKALGSSFNESLKTPETTSLLLQTGSGHSESQMLNSSVSMGWREAKKGSTAPSPTVNTKEALQVIQGLFNNSLNIGEGEMFGIFDEDKQMDVLSDARQVTEQRNKKNPCTTFTIYEEQEPLVPSLIPVVLNSTENEFERKEGRRGYPLQPITDSIASENQQTGLSEIKSKPDDNPEFVDDMTVQTCGLPSPMLYASTPFHPWDDAHQLPMLPMSNIRGTGHIAGDDNTSSNFSKSQVCQPTDEFGKSSLNRNALSPITEGSNEDKNSIVSSQGSDTSTGHTSKVSNKGTGSCGKQTDVESDCQRAAGKNDTLTSCKEKGDQLHPTIGALRVGIPDADGADCSRAVVVNPFATENLEKILAGLEPPVFQYHNYYWYNTHVPQLKPESILDFGDGKQYTIERQIGAGGFAKIYKALMNRDALSSQSPNYVVIKLQNPACKWELYICNEIQKRLVKLNDPVDVSSSMLRVLDGHFFKDGSLLISELSTETTLLDFVKTCIKLSNWNKYVESVATYCTIELLHLLEKLHRCQIIHGDLKPDNILIKPSYESFLGTHSATGLLKLIDFGESIDMSKYPPGTTFRVKVKTADFQCIEMLTNRPWTYQTDLFGLAGSVHVILFGKYMKVHCERGVWRITSNFVRKWNVSLWKRFFDILLNIPSCDELPDLAKLRKDFEEYFFEHLENNFKSFGVYALDSIHHP